MSDNQSVYILLLTGFLASGCASIGPQRPGQSLSDPQAQPTPCRISHPFAGHWAQILALDPSNVEQKTVRDLLSRLPAPQIITIHGGVLPIESGMRSFATFLVKMGYPEAHIRNAATESYAYGYYDRSDELAGAVAWYYERDGLRPLIIGHSQGGIQTIRVLHKLAGAYGNAIPVFNPLSEQQEPRFEITDPLTGESRSVVGFRLPYATAALAGGLARLLPNQWDMTTRLRRIPDSVEEFTGFQKGMDLLGGDLLGYGEANDYRATGDCVVRNVRLPSMSPHSSLPYSATLLEDPAIREWITNYRPAGSAAEWSGEVVEFGARSARALWAAEVWYNIKKYWVIELQRLVRAHDTVHHDT